MAPSRLAATPGFSYSPKGPASIAPRPDDEACPVQSRPHAHRSRSHRTVDAPRERVFDYLSDIANHAEFSDHYLHDFRLERLDSTGRGRGGELAASTFRSGGNGATRRSPSSTGPTRIVLEGRSGRIGRIPTRAEYRLIAGRPRHDAGRVRVRDASPATPFDRLKESLGMRGWLRRKARRALRPAGACAGGGQPLRRTRSDRRLDRLPRSMDPACASFASAPAAALARGWRSLLSLALRRGCGNERRRLGRRGRVHRSVGEVDYQVQLTRLLNPQQRPDDAYLRGQAPLPGDEAYLGVFLRIENDGDEPYKPPRDMKVDRHPGQRVPARSTRRRAASGSTSGRRSRPAAWRRRRTRPASVRPDLRRDGPVPREGGVGDRQPAAGAGDSGRGRGGALDRITLDV